MSIRYFSAWTKRTGYMLQSHNEKGTYVTDAHPSALVTYDPFSCADDILLELLTIGKQKRTGRNTTKNRGLLTAF